MSKVTISLVTYNNVDTLPQCLDSVFKQTHRDWELIIVDNNSTDGTKDYLNKLFEKRRPNLKILFNKDNQGFAKSHNQVTSQSQSEYILVLNPDVVLEKDYLAILVNFLDIHPRVGVVSGKLLQLNLNQKLEDVRERHSPLPTEQSKEIAHRISPRRRDDIRKDVSEEIIDSLGLGLTKKYRVVNIGEGQRDENQSFKEKEVFGVSATAALYRRKALMEVGLFDPDFFCYQEDIDLAHRLLWQNWENWVLPKAVAWHQRKARSIKEGTIGLIKYRKTKNDFINYYSYRNHLFFLIKNLSLANLFLYFPFIFWYEFKKLIYLCLFERKTLRAYVDLFTSLPELFQKRKMIMKTRKVNSKKIRKWIKVKD